jgi:hydroxymethylpyrimidine/phosphomethylpyrimidine kinase
LIKENKTENSQNISKILTIAGSDSGGGAGIQADIKTATFHNVYIASVVTCLTAQNSCNVVEIHNPPTDFLAIQLKTVLDDISFSVIKTGMVGNKNNIEAIFHSIYPYLSSHKPQKQAKLIVDPVMVATSGDILLEKSAIQSLKDLLIANCYLTTPNINEAEILANISINNLAEMKRAAIIIKDIGAKNVLIKGGHLENNNHKITSILLDSHNNFHLISNKKIIIYNNKNNDKIEFHGTGCSLATAIACNIAKNIDIINSVKLGNRYIFKALKHNIEIGKGSRVLRHF